MRKVFVLASLFIGLSYGFIVLPGVQEIDNSISSTESLAIKSREKTSEPNLEKSNKIYDHEIYENIKEKENNLTERSFIYLNQKYKSHHKTNQLYLSKDILKERHPGIYIPQDYPAVPGNPAKKLFTPNIAKIKTTTKLHYSKYPPPAYQYDFPERMIQNNNLNQKYQENIKLHCEPPRENNKLSRTPVEPPRKDKTFQLKAPLLRPLSNIKQPEIYFNRNKESNYNKIQRITSHARLTKDQTFNCTFPKPYQFHRSALRRDELSHNFEDFEGRKEVNQLGRSRVSDDDDKLERLIKKTLEENGLNQLIDDVNDSHEYCEKHQSNYKI